MIRLLLLMLLWSNNSFAVSSTTYTPSQRPIVHFNLKEFLASRCSSVGAKTSGCSSDQDNKINFYVPTNFTDKKWRSTAPKQEEGGNPYLIAGQSIQLNGEIFFKDSNPNNALILGFIGNGKVYFKCIKNLNVASRYTNNNPDLPNTHWNLRFRAPAEPGDYRLFFVNATSDVTLDGFYGGDIDGVSVTPNKESICNMQTHHSESSMTGFSDLKESFMVVHNTFIRLYEDAFGADFNKSRVLSERVIKVKPDFCSSERASNVIWPHTETGITVNATNSMCGEWNRTVVGATTRTCTSDPETGRSLGWGPVNGRGCHQRCDCSSTFDQCHFANGRLWFIRDNNNQLNFSGIAVPNDLYEFENITYHAGSVSYPYNGITPPVYQFSSAGRSVKDPNHPVCWGNSDNPSFTNKSVTVNCQYSPGTQFGRFVPSSNASCYSHSQITRWLNTVHNSINYYSYNKSRKVEPWGQYGIYEAYLDGSNPFALNWPTQAMLPNDGDRVMAIFDQTIRARDFNLSGVEAYYRSGSGGGIEITGRSTRNITTDAFTGPFMGGRFALNGMFTFVDGPADFAGRNLFGFYTQSTRIEPDSKIMATLGATKTSHSTWTPVFRYHQENANPVSYTNEIGNASISFAASSREHVGDFPRLVPTFVGMSDNALDMISYNVVDTSLGGTGRPSNDCLLNHADGRAGWHSGGGLIAEGYPGNGGIEECQSFEPNGKCGVYPDCCRYCSNYFEKSPVKFMVSSTKNFNEVRSSLMTNNGIDYMKSPYRWAQYFYPQARRHLDYRGLVTLQKSYERPANNGVWIYHPNNLVNHSIFLGEANQTSVMHKVMMIRWDNGFPTESRYGSRNHPDRQNNWTYHAGSGYWGSWSGTMNNETILPWRNQNETNRLIVENFYLDIHRSLELYTQFNNRYNWSRAHGVQDSCLGRYTSFNWNVNAKYNTHHDPCFDGLGAHFNWGRGTKCPVVSPSSPDPDCR